jgi:uncharacterized protein
MNPSRRQLLLGGMWTAAAACVRPVSGKAPESLLPKAAQPLPLSAVRLLPSEYATAVEVNRTYLLQLDPDRLLHEFRAYAGLEPKAPVYGGWESDTIAGHTLGHYMSALVLMHDQTGDAECRRRADYIVTELAVVQQKRGTGYIGALGRRRKDKTVVDGEEIFPEVMSGHIESGGFDLNGSWSPLYTVHKVFAGLLDIHNGWNNAQALTVAVGLATYFEKVFAALDDTQMQKMLGTEYGGLNESFAELYAQTRDRRWLVVAERLYDRKVLDPLTRGQDDLANIHSNTQVPKLIGLARLHELTGKPDQANAAQYFWAAVTQHHSYVIGGNADREYFTAPDTIATHITEQTCEHCNTYNMLKLTQHLYSWSPDGAWFDYYERAHLNHVMAAQNPRTSGFSYMTPLMTGSPREYSDPAKDPFWCCVGSGMESHSKHGAAIFYEGKDTLLVNLYIPATAHWQTHSTDLRLDTRYPYEPGAKLTLNKVSRSKRFIIALRVPGWAKQTAVSIEVNDKRITPVMSQGYALIERTWRTGDRVAITFPLELRMEPAAGDPDTVAVLRGPMVLAADLGPATTPWKELDPAMVGDSLLTRFTPSSPDTATYSTRGVLRPADLNFVPFYKQYDRLSAVYFKHFTESQWQSEQTAYAAEQARLRDIADRSVDIMHVGEMQPERDHNLTSERSYPVSYRGRNGRDARSGGFFEFNLAVKGKGGALVLQTTYWGDERPRDFDILIDDTPVATQHLAANSPGKFFDVDYAIPEPMTRGKQTVRIRFVPREGQTAGPVFGVRLLTAKPAG